MHHITRARTLIISAVMALALLPAHPSSARDAGRGGAFAPVDEADRAPVAELLERLVEYQRTQEWGRFYDIAAAEYRRGRSRDEFVGERLSAAYEMFYVFDFTPKLTYVNDPPYGRYTFAGCGDVYAQGRRQTGDIYVTVIFEGGRWLVSEVSMLRACGVPPELKCAEHENL